MSYAGDLWYYGRVECCILWSAVGVLEACGLPVPARVEGVYSGQLGDPSCCDALIVTAGTSRNNPAVSATKRGCGPLDKVVEWEVRIFRDACQTEPECGDPLGSPSCVEFVGCPGESWPAPPDLDPCDPLSRGWQQALMKADRQALESGLAAQVDDCLCQSSAVFDCGGDGCLFVCDQPTTWLGSQRVSGGGCGGTILKFQTHTISK